MNPKYHILSHDLRKHLETHKHIHFEAYLKNQSCPKCNSFEFLFCNCRNPACKVCKIAVELKKQDPKVGPKARNKKRKSVIENDSSEKETSVSENNNFLEVPDKKDREKNDDTNDVEITGTDSVSRILIKRESTENFKEKEINLGEMNVSDDEPDASIKREVEPVKTS